MHNFAADINRNLLGNIKYRNNVVTGEVAVDNGNYTYDVYLSGSAVAYPNIPTTMREPDFMVGDAVEILIEYGNKEMPIIIGLAKKIVQDIQTIDINTLVTTLDAYDIAINSAYLEGRIEEIDGYENCLLRGFHYGLTTGYGTDTYTTGSFEAGCYSLQVTGLSENIYNFQAYVLDYDGDEQKGENKTMTISAKKIYVMYQDNDTSNHLKQYDISGNLLNTWSVPTGYYETNCICVDSNNNIYINYGSKIVKRDINGNIILTKTGIDSADAIAIGPDGYVYTREYNGPNPLIFKRDANDLEIIDSFAVYVKNWYGLTFDSDGYFYMCNATDQRMEKLDFVEYEVVATHSITTNGADDSGLCVVGNAIGMAAGFQGAFTMPKDLSLSESNFNLGDIDSYVHEGPASLGDAYIFIGDYLGTHLTMQSYNSSKVLSWQVNVSSTGESSVDSALAAAYPF